ncbi:glycosyl hydrolase family 76-domain-containing protein [Triangularia verruculosa]|uniref:Mannan endo-1,6-alpha-mannosidase n=1 Tax=Triangularia verruculosa TaxID=2587418 RepID=A0AAN6XH44_9PEZI|nr:glycosyl hydrolase family 76-domain-containing protein [Triangularia verruculosa]
MKQGAFSVAVLSGVVGIASAALDVDFGSADSIRLAAKDVAFDAVSYYKGNETGETPGVLGYEPLIPGGNGEYWWWTGSVFASTLIDYWFYTGDDSYNAIVSQGLAHQAGPNRDYMPPNYTHSLSNDDQGFWGVAAMQAAELDFPTSSLDWSNLAQNVWSWQVSRFKQEETKEICGGGLRWQVPPSNAGYNYKNTVSNAVLINLSARLGRWTGNSTYVEWAERAWTWLTDVGFLTEDFRALDGAHVELNCTDINKAEFSYNAGVLLQSAAFLYNQTTGDVQTRWRERVAGLTNATLARFFEDGYHFELSCEGRDGACSSDMLFFKGMVTRFLASTVQVAPFTKDRINEVLKTNAEAAVKTCTGGDNKRQCSFSWAKGKFHDSTDLPSQLNALSALTVLLQDEVSQKSFATNATSNPGGGSEGGNGSGSNNQGNGGQDQNGNGNGGSAGTTTRVTVGVLLAGLVAALL